MFRLPLGFPTLVYAYLVLSYVLKLFLWNYLLIFLIYPFSIINQSAYWVIHIQKFINVNIINFEIKIVYIINIIPIITFIIYIILFPYKWFLLSILAVPTIIMPPGYGMHYLPAYALQGLYLHSAKFSKSTTLTIP